VTAGSANAEAAGVFADSFALAQLTPGPNLIIVTLIGYHVAGIAGAFVARMSGRPFVYNIRDMYPDMALGGDIVRANSLVARWEKMHRRALREAARVIVLGDDMRERILSKGVAPERIAVVRDGASPSGPLPDRTHPTVEQVRCGFPFVVLHAGNLGFYGAWSTLLKAAELLRNENTGLVFVGDGANRAAMQSSINGSRNVRFLPFRPTSEIPHVMTAGDLHIITVKRGLEGVVVPSKLYSTLAAGRPVLVVAPPECDAARIVRESGCGIAADPDDPLAVAEAIRELRDDPNRLAEMGRRARETAGKYARVNELQRFAAIVEDAARIN